MEYYTFRRIMRSVKRRSSIAECRKTHKEYEASLYTAPVEDNEATAKEFINAMFKNSQPFNLCFSECTTQIAPTVAFTQQYYDEPRCKEQEGKTQMNTNTERDYLARRVETVYYELEAGLAKQFHLHGNTNPPTYKQMIDWVKNDKFTLDVKITAKIDAIEADEPYYGSFLDGIVWNGAGFSADREGYNVARKVLVTARTTARDIVMTQDATAGLAALNAFEAWTYTAPAVAPAA